MRTLSELSEHAKAHGIGVWLDAEQFARQPAMNFLSRTLMQRVNTEPDRILLFNTYQCYLKVLLFDDDFCMIFSDQDALDWIRFDVEHAQQEGSDNPVREGKAKTDRAYDEAVRYVLREMVAKYGSVALALCTHNRASLEAATASMEQLGIARDSKYVVTAQLKGMVDNITHAFGNSGYNPTSPTAGRCSCK